MKPTERSLLAPIGGAEERSSADLRADSPRTTHRPPKPSSNALHLDACLRVTAGLDLGRLCAVGATPISVGTAASNDMCLSDRRVSRIHCQLFVRGDQVVIRDMNSTNGTYLDHTRVQEAMVRPGARIRIGTTELTLQSLALSADSSGEARAGFGEMVGSSPLMQQLFAALQSVARSELTCLLLGETGTGKELAARALHEHSTRARKPFLVVDCAAVGPQFIEDKLFGHQRGAFTGASQAVPGVFEEATGGTVFLDEIGELPLSLQPKLLGVLERREATRIGSHAPVRLDARVVAATHCNLPDMAKRGHFRQDLLYRLSEFTLRIPTLRERREDIALIASSLLKAEGYSRTLTPDAIEYLQSQTWPGNVRELRNLLRRAALLAQGALIDRRLLEDLESVTSELHILPEQLEIVLPDAAQKPAVTLLPRPHEQNEFELPMAAAVEAFRKAYVLQLRTRFGNDLNAAAAHAGVHPKSVSRLFRLYGVY